MTSADRPRAGDENGSVAAELALVAVPLLLLFLLVVAAGRSTTVRAQVDAAARDAARAASIARTPAAARAAALDAARATLTEQGLTCQSFTVTTDTGRFQPGGSVTVEVTCGVPLADLSPLRLPGQRTLTATFRHPIDVFRGVPG